MLDFLKLVLTKEGTFDVPMDDDIVAACLMTQAGEVARREANEAMEHEIVSHTIINLIIFVLAIYVGYHVVWTVTPALHTPLMAVTNAHLGHRHRRRHAGGRADRDGARQDHGRAGRRRWPRSTSSAASW